MKSMSRALLTLAAAALVLTGFSTRAEATAISIDNIITTATTVDADLVVSGLNEVIGGFAFQIGYTPADFTGASWATSHIRFSTSAADSAFRSPAHLMWMCCQDSLVLPIS